MYVINWYMSTARSVNRMYDTTYATVANIRAFSSLASWIDTCHVPERKLHVSGRYYHGAISSDSAGP
jgi:hypothetical protein